MTRLAETPKNLTHVATYRRSVPVSLERVWENVLDWEHLPWLHDGSFSAATLHEAGDWGWRAKLGLPHRGGPPRSIELELLLAEPGDRYVSRTTEGSGAGSEIWTILESRGPSETAVHVEFWIPGVPVDRVDAVGALFTTLYTRLWDEDESMMCHRQRELDRPAALPIEKREGLELGKFELLRDRLPLDVEVDGLPFRLTLRGEDLAIHSTRCPHRLGPLEEAPDEQDIVRCPWHGYRFDSRTGANCDGRRLRLEPAPEIRIDPCSSQVQLVWKSE